MLNSSIQNNGVYIYIHLIKWKMYLFIFVVEVLSFNFTFTACLPGCLLLIFAQMLSVCLLQ